MCQNYQRNPWILNLASKILAGDPSVNSLVAYNPFSERPPTSVQCVCVFENERECVCVCGESVHVGF